MAKGGDGRYGGAGRYQERHCSKYLVKVGDLFAAGVQGARRFGQSRSSKRIASERKTTRTVERKLARFTRP